MEFFYILITIASIILIKLLSAVTESTKQVTLIDGPTEMHMESGNPCVSQVTAEQLRESFVLSPRKSPRRTSREIGITNVSVVSVTKTFTLKGVQTIHRSTPNGCRQGGS
jgi:hypothetical protein